MKINSVITIAVLAVLTLVSIYALPAKVGRIETGLESLKTKADSSEFLKFKSHNEQKIREADKKIAGFKAELSKKEEEVQDEFEPKIEAIEKKYDELRERLAMIKEEDSDWGVMVVKFNREVEEIGMKLAELTKMQKNDNIANKG